VWDALKEFDDTMGVAPNPNKCAVIIHKATVAQRRRIVEFSQKFGVPIVTEYKYLGVLVARRAAVTPMIRDVTERVIRRAAALAYSKVSRIDVRSASICYQATVADDNLPGCCCIGDTES